MSTRITLLGTGGGRHAAIYQTRSTGGLLLDCGQRIHVDPGPGALVNMHTLKIDPALTDCVMISHCHPDHYSDAEVIIEGMCKGGAERRGTVVGSQSVLKGHKDIGPCISSYHQKLAERYVTAYPDRTMDINGMRVDFTRSEHSDPTTVGFRFHTYDGIISYVSDTAYSDDVADQYEGSRIAMIPVTAPDDNRISYHMCTDDAIQFVERIRPELTVFVHMGIYMIKLGAEEQARKVEDATGSKVIAGNDLMMIDVDDLISLNYQ